MDVDKNFPVRFIGDIEITRKYGTGDGMTAFVMTNGFQNIGLYRKTEDLPSIDQGIVEHLTIGSDFTTKNPSMPIYTIIQNGGPEMNASILVDNLKIYKK